MVSGIPFWADSAWKIFSMTKPVPGFTSMSTSPNAPLSRSLAYSAPYFATAWLITPVAIVQGIYAKYYGLSLTLIATIILVVRFVDAVSDPLIGYWSDRFYQRTGTRKPFILVGGLLFILCAYFLYVPPAEVGALYFTGWFIAFYISCPRLYFWW